MDFLTVLDGLDQTSGDVAEGSGVDDGVVGKYSFHCMG